MIRAGKLTGPPATRAKPSSDWADDHLLGSAKPIVEGVRIQHLVDDRSFRSEQRERLRVTSGHLGGRRVGC